MAHGVPELGDEFGARHAGAGPGLREGYQLHLPGKGVRLAGLGDRPLDQTQRQHERIRAFGLEVRVFPVMAEAHDLPYANEFFDAVVSIDAYHYFGTDDLYLATHLARLVKPGGQIGIVVPGLTQEIPCAQPPEHLQPYWDPSFWSFHSPEWWRRHWVRSGAVDVELADMVPDGWRHWQTSDEASAKWLGQQREANWLEQQRGEAEMLRVDSGRYLGLTRVVARRRPAA